MAQTEDIKLRLTSGKGNLNWVDRQEFEDNIADYIAKNPGAKIRMVDVDKQQYDIPLDRYQDARKSGARPYMFKHTTVVKQPEKPDWRTGNKVGAQPKTAVQSQKSGGQNASTAMSPDNKALDYTRPSETDYANTTYAERAKEDPESNMTPQQKAGKNWAYWATRDATTQLTRPHIPLNEQGQLEGENINPDLLRTEKEVSEQASQRADEFANTIDNGGLADAVAKKYDDMAMNILSKYGGTAENDVIATSMAKTAKDPDTVLKALSKKTEDYLSNYFKDKNVLAQMALQARKAGVNVDQFKDYVANSFQTKLSNQLYEKMVAQQMPKNEIEYVMSGLNNTILGMINRSLESEGWRKLYADVENRATNTYGQGGIKIPLIDYQLNMANVLRTGVTFAGDAPFFGVTGKISAQALKAICKREINNLVAKGLTEDAAQKIIASKLESSMSKRIGARVLQGSTGGAVNLGTYNLMSEGARQTMEHEFDPEALAEKGAAGVGTGVLLGVGGGFVGGATSRVGLKGGATGLAKRTTAQLAGFLTEAGAFTAAEEAEKYLTGNEDKIILGQDFLGSIEQLLVMKGTNKLMPSGKGEVRRGGNATTNKNFFEKRVDAFRNMFKPQEALGMNMQTGGVRFTKDEQDHLKTLTGTKNLVEALSTMMPKNTRLVKPNGKTEEVTDEITDLQRKQLAQAYEDFMKDPDVTFAEKQKVALVLGGTINVNIPIATGHDVVYNDNGSATVITRDRNGNAIQRYNYATQAEADMFTLQQARLYQRNDAYILSQQNPDAAEQARQALYMDGYTVEQVEAALPTRPYSTIEQEGQDLTKQQEAIQAGIDAIQQDQITNEYYDYLKYYSGIDDTYTPDFHKKQGARLTGGERHNAMIEANRLLEACSDGTPEGEEFKRVVQAGEEDPAEALYQMAQQGVSPEKIHAATKYYNQKEKVDGMLDYASGSVDVQVAEANSQVWNNTHLESGLVMTVTDNTGKKYFIITGRYGYDPESGRPIKSECDQTLVVRDAETGELVIKPSGNMQLIQADDPNELVNYNETTMRENAVERLDREISYAEGTPTEPVPGDTFVGADGKSYTVSIDETSGTPLKVELDEKGQPTKNAHPLDMAEYMDSKSAEIDAQAEAERQAQAETESQQQAELAGEEPSGETEGTVAEGAEAGTSGGESPLGEQPANPSATEQLRRVSDREGNVIKIKMTNGQEGYFYGGNLNNPDGEFKFAWFDQDGNMQVEQYPVSDIESQEAININEQPMAATPESQNAEQPQITADEALRQQQLAEGEALAQRQEKLLKEGLVGYDTGKPDLTHPNTKPEAAAEYLIKESEGNINKAQEKAKEQVQQANADIDTYTDKLQKENEWQELWSDVATADEQQQHEWALRDAKEKLAEAQRLQKRWAQIHEAMMSPEAKEKAKQERKDTVTNGQAEGFKEAETTYANMKPDTESEGLMKDKNGKPIFAKSTPEAVDKHIDTNYAGNESDYIADRKKDLKQESEDLDNESERLASMLREYENGEGLLNESAAIGVAKQLGQLAQRRHQIAAEVRAMTEAGRRFENRKAKLEAERRRKEREAWYNSLTDEQKARLEEYQQNRNRLEQQKIQRKQALDAVVDPQKKLQVARQIYSGTEGEQFLDDASMEPQTVEEYVSNIGRHVLAWDSYMQGDHKIRGAQEDLGLKRGIGRNSDTYGINDFFAKKGEGKGIEQLVHELWEGRPNPEWTDSEIRNALIEMLSTTTSAKEARNKILNDRIARAEEAASSAEEAELDWAYSDVQRYSKKARPSGEAEGTVAEQPKTSAEELEVAKEETDTNPTEAQKEAGNYKKGHIKAGDLDVTVENPAGSVRKGTDKNGNEWSTTMHYTYGYIRGHEGADGDHVDIVVNDAADLWHWNGKVYIVDQKNDDGTFDEHKVMYGFDSMEEARQAYLSNYEPGWESHIQAVTGVDRTIFKEWLDSSDKKLDKPFAETPWGRESRYNDLYKAFDKLRAEQLKGNHDIQTHAVINMQMNAIRREMRAMGIAEADIPKMDVANMGLNNEGLGAYLKANAPELTADIDELAKQVGVKFAIITEDQFKEMVPDQDPVNGFYSPNDNTVYVLINATDVTPNGIAKARGQIVKAVFGHEMNHKNLEDKDFKAQILGLAEPLIEKYYNRIKEGEYKKVYDEKKKAYKEQLDKERAKIKLNNPDATPEQLEELYKAKEKSYIHEEMFGDMTGEAMMDRNFVSELIGDGKNIEDPSILGKLRTAYRDFKNKIKNFKATDEEKEINEIQKLIRKAYLNSVKAQVEKTNAETEKSQTSETSGTEQPKLSKKNYFEIGKRFFDDVLHAPVTDFYDVEPEKYDPNTQADLSLRGETLATMASDTYLTKARRNIISIAKQWKGQIGNAAAGAFIYNGEVNGEAMPSLAKWISRDIIDGLEDYKSELQGFREYKKQWLDPSVVDEEIDGVDNAIKWYEEFGRGEHNLLGQHEIDNIMYSKKDILRRDRAEHTERPEGTLATAGTLFSGGGLLEQGLKGVVEPKFAAEWDKKIRGVYRDNNGDHMIFADATDITLPDIMQAVRGGHVDYLHTSPVCKNFSGAKLNRGETEGDMEFGKACARAIAMTEPDVYTLENVPAYQSSEALKRVTDMLDRLGYTWDVNVIDAADYGAATSRKRMILRAVKEGLTLPPLPAYKERGDWYERIKDLVDNEYKEDGQDIAYQLDIDLGDEIDVTKPFIVMGKQYDKWRIRKAGEPAPTITASNTGNEWIIEPEGNKDPSSWWVTKVTPRMLARIQGLSDDYKLPESATLAHTIIGNGIPTELTKEVIAPMIVSRVNERKDKKQADARIEAKYDRLAQDYIPEFSRGTKKEDELRKVFDEYVTAQADDNIVPFLAPHMQYAGSVRTTAHKLKGEKYDRVNGKRQLVPITPEAQQEAINGAASDMATMVPKNAVLVPMPSHTGKATNTVPLAEAISKLTGAPVLDALEGLSRRSAHEAKMHGGRQLQPEQMGMHWKEGVEVPEGKRIVYIDNVIDNGNTAAAAVRAGKGGIVLAYAYAGDLKSKAVPLKSAELVTYDDHGQVIPLNERFNPTSDDIRFSKKVEDSDPFYSNAAKAVEGIKQGKATPEQWLKMIEKAGGLKKEEDKWMGLSDWLKGQDKKTLTREEVENFIAENAVKVEEVHYGESEHMSNFAKIAPYLVVYERDYNNLPDSERQSMDLTTYEYNRLLAEHPELANLDFSEPEEPQINEIRSQYTTKGLENNKEIALTVPTIDSYYGSLPEVHFADDYTKGKTVAWVRFGEATTHIDGYHEAIVMREKARKAYWDFEDTLRKKYHLSSDDYQFKTISAEDRAELIRLRDEYKDAASKAERQNFDKKVLVIDEIQSQRHQDGREKGYDTDKKRTWREVSDELAEMRAKVAQRVGKDKNYLMAEDYTPEEWEAYDAKYKEMEALVEENDDKSYSVPDAPFRANWHELGMKRMLRYAAENDYDMIAWTTGAQQAKRYGLGSVVDHITAGIDLDGNRSTIIYMTDGTRITYDHDAEGNITHRSGHAQAQLAGAKHLADVIGKDLTAEILAQTERGYSGAETYDGDDLLIGGEGMKGFYDNMLVKFMNKYGKKWGVKVGTVELYDVEDDASKMWSVDVTPEMKESVMEGQPMFSKKTIKPSGEAEGEEPAVRYSLIGKKGALSLDEFEKYRDKQLKRIAKMETALGIHGKWHMQEDRQRWEKIFEDDKEQRLKNLKVAQRMDASKRNKPTAETIKRATGWEKGADGQWRYEIGDATLSDKLLQNIDKVQENGPMMQGRFRDLVNAPELLEAYPELGDYYVNIYNAPNDSFYGFQRGRSIYLNIGKAKEDATPTAKQLGTVASTVAEQIEGAKQWSWTNTLNHEIQHCIQDIEGFAQGGNKDSVHDILQKIRDEHKYLNDADMAAINLWTSDSNRAFEMHRAEYLMERPARFLKSGEHFKYSGSKAEIIEQGQKLAAKDYYNGLMMLETVANRMGIDLANYGLDLEKMSDDLDAMEGRGMTPMDVARTGYMIREMQKFYDDVEKIQDKRIKENQNLEKAHAYETIDKALKNIYDDYELYKRLAGEVEARAVGSRVGMTQQERRESPSVDSEDVKRNQQLPIRNNNILAGGIRFSKKATDKGNSVEADEDGSVRFSFKTEQDPENKKLVDAVANTYRGQWVKEDLDKMLTDTDDIIKQIMPLLDIHPDFMVTQNRTIALNSQGKPIYNVFFNNHDTEAPTIEFSTNCVKKEAMNNLMEVLKQKGILHQLNEVNLDTLLELLEKHGYSIPCKMCFVEARRNMIHLKEDFVDKWNKVADIAKLGKDYVTDGVNVPFDEKRIKILEAYINKNGAKTMPGRIAQMMIDYPELRGRFNREDLLTASGYEDLWQRFGETPLTGMLEGLAGAASPKPTFDSHPFDQRMFDARYTDMRPYFGLAGIMNGGFRSRSFSDADPNLFVDEIQMRRNLVITKSGMFGYTKVPYMVDLFGETGEFHNMSLVVEIDPEGEPYTDKKASEQYKHAGLIRVGDPRHQKSLGLTDEEYEEYKKENNLKDGDWDYYFSQESFPVRQALAFRKDPRFGGRVGTILVVTSDEMMEKALDDDRIDMIIGYHSSGKGKESKEKVNYDLAKDYTGLNETKGSTREATKNYLPTLKMYAPTYYNDGIKGIDFNYDEACQTLRDPRLAAQAYLEWCDINGFTPKYEQHRGHRNYYKLLENFRRIDNEGKPVIMEPLEMKLPQDWATRLDTYLTEREGTTAKNNEIAHDTELMKDVQKALGTRVDLSDAKLSKKRDQEYMDAVESNDTEKARQLMREAAKEAMPDTKIVDENGYPREVYHGTRDGGFTVFRLGMDYEGKGVFTADTRKAAVDYAKKDSMIDLPNFKDGDIDGALKWLNNRTKQYNMSFTVEQGKDPDGDDIWTLLEHTTSGRTIRYDVGSQYTPEDLTDYIKDQFNNNEDSIYPVYLNIKNPKIIDANGASWKQIWYNGHFRTADSILKELKNEGKYDGLVIKNVFDSWTADGPIDDAIAFYPEQVKITDPVTYDDFGNVIPLSERFNDKEEDIRFSKKYNNRNYPDYAKDEHLEQIKKSLDVLNDKSKYDKSIEVAKATREEFEKAHSKAEYVNGQEYANVRKKVMNDAVMAQYDNTTWHPILYIPTEIPAVKDWLNKNGWAEGDNMAYATEAGYVSHHVNHHPYTPSTKPKEIDGFTADLDPDGHDMQENVTHPTIIGMAQGNPDSLVFIRRSRGGNMYYTTVIKLNNHLNDGRIEWCTDFAKGVKPYKKFNIIWDQEKEMGLLAAAAGNNPPEGVPYSSAKVQRNSETTKGNQEKVAQNAENNEISPEMDSGMKLSKRTKPAPKKTVKVYKLMRLGDDGELHALYIDGGAPIKLHTWYDADSPSFEVLRDLPSGNHLIDLKTGKVIKSQTADPGKAAIVDAENNGQRWMSIVPTTAKSSATRASKQYAGQARQFYNWGINGSGGATTYALRPGWHAASLPVMDQIGSTAKRNIRDDRFVWVEGEISFDKDYQKEAESNPSGENDIPFHIPEDGAYMKGTSNMVTKGVTWWIAGSFKPERIIGDREARKVVDNFNDNEKDPDAPNMHYDWPRMGGRVFDADKMQLVEGTPEEVHYWERARDAEGQKTLVGGRQTDIRFSKRTPAEEKEIWDEAKKDFPWMPEYETAEQPQMQSIEDMTAEERRKFGEDLYLGTNRRMKAMILLNAKGMSPYDQNRMAEATINTLYNIADTGARNEAEQELLDKAKSMLSEDTVRYSKKQMDDEYEKAVKEGDMARATELYEQAKAASGYNDDNSWRMTHRAPTSKYPEYQLVNSSSVPSDYWQHPEWYANGPEDRESMRIIRPLLEKYKKLVEEGKQEEADAITVDVYRGVDKSKNSKEGGLRAGDWVTPSKAYAHNEALKSNNGGRVIKETVKLKDLYFNGDSASEMGWDDGNSYVYKDTKNNRKLDEVVTYDDEGNLIPLSKRFNTRNPDIRYSKRVPKMRNGESPEAYRDRIDAFNRQQARETDTIKRALVERISELVDDQNLTAINRRRLRSMLRMVELTHANVSEEYYRRAEGVVAEMRTASQQRQIDKLLALKTQDVNGKNMSIAKNVSDDVRKVMEMLRGRIVDLKNSGYEEDMTALRRNIRALTEENKNLEDQIDRGDLDKYQEDEALRTIADNKADIEQCRQDLESLKELKEETERAKLGVRDLDLQGEFDRLEEKLDQAAEGRYVFTAGDRQQYTALEILKLQNEIMKLRNQSNDLKRNRDTTEEALSHLADPNDLNMSDRLLREWDSKNTLIRGIEQEIDNRQKDMIDKLQTLISHGKAELKTKIEDELNRRKELLTNMFNDIGGKGGRKLWTMTPKQRKESQHESKVKQFFTAQLGSFEYMAQRIARNTLGEDGWFYKNFVKGNEGVIAARNTYLTGLKEATVTMNDKCQEIYGMPLEKVIQKNGKKEKNTGIYLTREIHGQEIEEPMECSKGQATYWYMVWKMPDGRAKLLNQGFTEQTIAEIREFIGDENAEWADWVQKTYLADLREKYNAKYVDIYNTSMANIANYVPIKIDETDIQRESDLLDDKARKKSLTERAGSLINRTYNTKPIDLTVSAYEVVMNHVNQMEEWNAFARVRKDLDYILGNTAVRNQLNANVSGQWNDLMDASAIATHVYKPAKAEFGDNFMAAITKGIVGGNIAFRYTTALKQMLSVPAFMGYSQDPRFLMALAKNIGVQYTGNIPVLATTMATFGAVGGQHSFKRAAEGKKFTGLTNTVNWCAKNLPGFAERIAKGSAGNYALDDATLGKVLDGYLNKGMVANQMVDAITCAIGIKTMYDYKYARLKADIKKKGLTAEEEKKALEEAHRIALNDADIYYNGTQQSNDAAFLSPMQMSRTMMNKALSVYQNASIGFARKFATSAEDLWRMRHWGDLKARLMDEGMTGKQATAYLGKQAFKNVVGMILYGYAMNALWDLGGMGLLGLYAFGGDDDDEKKDTSLQDIATYISYPMRGMPGMNIVSSLLGGTLKSPLLAYDVADELRRDLEKVYQDNGPVSLEMASLIGNKLLRYAGIDSKAWTNIYLGTERMVREGLLNNFENKDKMIDLMLFLNTPNTNRVDVAKKIYKGEPDEVYATNVLRAMKYLDDADEGWAASLGSLTGMKALTIDKEAQIFKELGITPSEIKGEEVKDIMKKYESLNNLYDAYDKESDPKRKQTIGKAISKTLTQKKYSDMTRAERIAEGKALTTTQTSDKSKQNTIYIGLCKHNDLVQDEALAEALKKLKPTYDEYNDMEDPDEANTFYESHKQIIDKYEELNDSRKEINALKNDMKESDTQERLNSMNEIRKIRSKALGIR